MKRYIKSSTNINQNLVQMNYEQKEQFVQGLEPGTIIQFEADYGDWQHPEAEYTHLSVIHKKIAEDTWITKYGDSNHMYKERRKTPDKTITGYIEYDYTDTLGEDPRKNGEITVFYNGESYTTPVPEIQM